MWNKPAHNNIWHHFATKHPLLYKNFLEGDTSTREFPSQSHGIHCWTVANDGEIWWVHEEIKFE